MSHGFTHWYYNDKIFDFTQYMTKISYNTLSIHATDISYNGKYTCRGFDEEENMFHASITLYFKGISK